MTGEASTRFDWYRASRSVVVMTLKSYQYYPNRKSTIDVILAMGQRRSGSVNDPELSYSHILIHRQSLQSPRFTKPMRPSNVVVNPNQVLP